jgi:hypothetical protein
MNDKEIILNIILFTIGEFLMSGEERGNAEVALPFASTSIYI